MRWKWVVWSLTLMALVVTPFSLNAQVDEQDDKIMTEEALELFPNDLCSLEFRGANVKNVLRSLAVPYRVNLLVNEQVKGTITASFNEVPLREVIKSILKNANLGYVREGDILRVDTMAALKQGKEEMKTVQETVTKYFQLKYAFDSGTGKDLTDLVTELKKKLSKHDEADISIIKRINTIVVTDLPENVAKIEEMINNLDKVSPQVAIMAKIVSVSTDFTRELGIQWGGAKTNAVGGEALSVSGGNANNYIVNMPAAADSIGGAVDLMIGEVAGDVLSMRLSAMEKESKGKVISNPKIITQDNRPAKMQSTHKVFYEVTTRGTDGTTTTSYKGENVKITLDVTPHVIDGEIFMDVQVEKGDVLPNTAGPPDIKTNTLTTKVLVDSGKTVVIGGLIEQDESDLEGGVPWLKDIPLLGWLFKYTKDTDNKNELLIFITPTILREGKDNVQKVLSLN